MSAQPWAVEVRHLGRHSDWIPFATNYAAHSFARMEQARRLIEWDSGNLSDPVMLIVRESKRSQTSQLPLFAL